METSLNRRAKVELFEQIRREYEHGVGTTEGTDLLHAKHGERRGISSVLSARNAASVFGGARVCVRPFWGSLSQTALRQSDERSEENPSRAPAGRDGAIYRVPIALGIR